MGIWKRESAALLLALSMLSAEERAQYRTEINVLDAIVQNWVLEFTLSAMMEGSLPHPSWYKNGEAGPEEKAMIQPIERAIQAAQAARATRTNEVAAMHWLARALATKASALAALMSAIADDWESPSST